MFIHCVLYTFFLSLLHHLFVKIYLHEKLNKLKKKKLKMQLAAEVVVVLINQVNGIHRQ